MLIRVLVALGVPLVLAGTAGGSHLKTRDEVEPAERLLRLAPAEAESVMVFDRRAANGGWPPGGGESMLSGAIWSIEREPEDAPSQAITQLCDAPALHIIAGWNFRPPADLGLGQFDKVHFITSPGLAAESQPVLASSGAAVSLPGRTGTEFKGYRLEYVQAVYGPKKPPPVNVLVIMLDADTLAICTNAGIAEKLIQASSSPGSSEPWLAEWRAIIAERPSSLVVIHKGPTLYHQFFGSQDAIDHHPAVSLSSLHWSSDDRRFIARVRSDQCEALKKLFDTSACRLFTTAWTREGDLLTSGLLIRGDESEQQNVGLMLPFDFMGMSIFM